MNRKIFVNLPVRDLDETIRFFAELGFEFDPRFTDENATCMIVSENIYVMLLVENFYETFIPEKKTWTRSDNNEAIIALFLDSRKEVDDLVNKAVKFGGTEYRVSDEYEMDWMYGRSFEDINGHLWEISYMDETKMPEEMKQSVKVINK